MRGDDGLVQRGNPNEAILVAWHFYFWVMYSSCEMSNHDAIWTFPVQLLVLQAIDTHVLSFAYHIRQHLSIEPPLTIVTESSQSIPFKS